MIELLDLDDRTFADLMAQARALIPTLTPGWADHNPTDPGIVLVELFAWLTEIVLYRIDRVPDRSYRTFLRLLRGPDPSGPPPALDDAIRATLGELRERHRAITREDFEHLALHRWKTLEEAQRLGVVRRVRCLPELEPDAPAKPLRPAAGHYTLVIVPDPVSTPDTTALLDGLHAFLDEWRLLTTKVHVIDRRPLSVNVKAKLYLRSDGVPEAVDVLAREAVKRFLDPLQGWDGAGWPFGRAIYTSELHAVFDNLPGVDFVEGVEIQLMNPAEPDRPPAPVDGPNVVGVALHPHELPDLVDTTFDLFHRVRTRWQPI